MKPVFEIDVVNEWLVQGNVRYGERLFYYKCDSGRQYLAELDTSSENEFAELSATCLCEAFGKKHLYRDLKNMCDSVWTENLATHEEYAKLCIEVLLFKRG